MLLPTPSDDVEVCSACYTIFGLRLVAFHLVRPNGTAGKGAAPAHVLGDDAIRFRCMIGQCAHPQCRGRRPGACGRSAWALSPSFREGHSHLRLPCAARAAPWARWGEWAGPGRRARSPMGAGLSACTVCGQARARPAPGAGRPLLRSESPREGRPHRERRPERTTRAHAAASPCMDHTCLGLSAPA